MEESIQLSAEFSYVMSKKLDGISGGGTTGNWSSRVSKIYGICSEKYFPDKFTTEAEDYKNYSIPIMAYLDASTRRIPYFQRLFTLKECTDAISQSKGILLGFECFSSIRNVPTGHIPIPELGEEQIGSHSVYAFGFSYTEKYIHFVNSWGESWGDKGHGYLPMAYFDDDLINEAWVMGKDKGIRAEKEYIIRDKNNKKFVVKHNTYNPLRSSTPSFLNVYDIYTSGNVIVGFLQASLFNKSTLEIEDFYIIPPYQNIGIGSELLKIIEKTAKNNKLQKIIGWLGAQDIISDKEIAIKAFFKKNKYTLTTDNTRYKDAVYKYEKLLFFNRNNNSTKTPD